MPPARPQPTARTGSCRAVAAGRDSSLPPARTALGVPARSRVPRSLRTALRQCRGEDVAERLWRATRQPFDVARENVEVALHERLFDLGDGVDDKRRQTSLRQASTKLV